MSLVSWKADVPTVEEALEFVRIGHPVDYAPDKTRAVLETLAAVVARQFDPKRPRQGFAQPFALRTLADTLAGFPAIRAALINAAQEIEAERGYIDCLHAQLDAQ